MPYAVALASELLRAFWSLLLSPVSRGATCRIRGGKEACRCPAPDLKHEPREALAGFPPAPALHSVGCCWHAATGSVVASRVLSTSSAVPLTLPKH